MIKYAMHIVLTMGLLIIGCSPEQSTQSKYASSGANPSTIESAPSRLTRPSSLKAQALNVYQAINSNDVSALTALIDLPFIIREQEFNSAEDGIGIVLGTATDTLITTDQQLEKTLQKVLPRITISNDTVRDLCTNNLLPSSGVKNVLNQSFIIHKLLLSVRFCLA